MALPLRSSSQAATICNERGRLVWQHLGANNMHTSCQWPTGFLNTVTSEKRWSTQTYHPTRCCTAACLLTRGKVIVENDGGSGDQGRSEARARPSLRDGPRDLERQRPANPYGSPVSGNGLWSFGQRLVTAGARYREIRMAHRGFQTVTPAAHGYGFEADVECVGSSMEVTVKIGHWDQYRFVTQRRVRIQIR